MKKLVIFDLNGTLAESKSELDTEMSVTSIQIRNPDETTKISETIAFR